MKANFFYMLCFLIVGTWACKNAGSSKISINGHKYSLTKDEPGVNAKEGDYVYFKYKVRAKDSVVFNSEVQTPVVKFKMPKIEKSDPKASQPIMEILANMSKGDEGTITHVIDEELKKQIGMPGVNELFYDVVLVDVKSEEEFNKEKAEEDKVLQEKIASSQALVADIDKNIKQTILDFKTGKNKADVVTTASGLKYIIHQAGNGDKPNAGQMIGVNYYGTLMDGTRFDDSWSRGQDFSFPVGQSQVIKGWDEGVMNFPVGTKATLFIPYALAYGEARSPPTIPAKSDLVFYIEVNSIK